jgi:tetratricopeptide (TPR) repeat protein
MKAQYNRVALSIVFILALSIYLATLCPSVYVGDSGDFITASYTLGVAHPSGYPLYSILGKIFSMIPYGSVAWRYNLMSAVFAASASAIVSATVIKLSKNPKAAAGAGLLYATSVSVWDQATVAEVYGFHGLLLASSIFFGICWRDKKKTNYLILCAFTLGLSMTNHISTILYLPAFAYLIWTGLEKKVKCVGLEKIAAYISLPLILYLYIPWRAAHSTVYNWGKPDTLKKFIDHLSARAHRTDMVMTLTKEELFERFFGITYELITQTYGGFAFIVFGIYRNGIKHWAFLKFSGLFIALDYIYTLFLNDVSLKITVFGIPSIVVMSIWCGLGISEFIQWMGKSKNKIIIAHLVVGSVIIATTAGNWHLSDRSQNLIAHNFGMNMLKTVNVGAVIFAQGDNIVFPLYYLVHVEKTKEVTIYEQNGIISWDLYGTDFQYLEYDERMKRAREREYDVILSGADVYYTSRPEYDFHNHKIIQAGLLYKVVPESHSGETKDYWSLYDYGGIVNTTIHLEYMAKQVKAIYYSKMAEDFLHKDRGRAAYLLEIAVETDPDNAMARYNLGNVYFTLGKTENAIEQLQKSIELDPKNPNAYNNIGLAYSHLGDGEKSIESYVQALRIEPRYKAARFNLAAEFANQGNYRDSLHNFGILLEIDRENANIHLNMGIIYSRIGNDKKAIESFEEYIRLKPETPHAQEIREILQELYQKDK